MKSQRKENIIEDKYHLDTIIRFGGAFVLGAIFETICNYETITDSVGTAFFIGEIGMPIWEHYKMKESWKEAYFNSPKITVGVLAGITAVKYLKLIF